MTTLADIVMRYEDKKTDSMTGMLSSIAGTAQWAVEQSRKNKQYEMDKKKAETSSQYMQEHITQMEFNRTQADKAANKIKLDDESIQSVMGEYKDKNPSANQLLEGFIAKGVDPNRARQIAKVYKQNKDMALDVEDKNIDREFKQSRLVGQKASGALMRANGDEASALEQYNQLRQSFENLPELQPGESPLRMLESLKLEGTHLNNQAQAKNKAARGKVIGEERQMMKELQQLESQLEVPGVKEEYESLQNDIGALQIKRENMRRKYELNNRKKELDLDETVLEQNGHEVFTALGLSSDAEFSNPGLVADIAKDIQIMKDDNIPPTQRKEFIQKIYKLNKKDPQARMKEALEDDKKTFGTALFESAKEYPIISNVMGLFFESKEDYQVDEELRDILRK